MQAADVFQGRSNTARTDHRISGRDRNTVPCGGGEEMKTLTFSITLTLCLVFGTLAWATTAPDSISVIDEFEEMETTFGILLGSNEAAMTSADWSDFSGVLGDALHSEVEGLRCSALRLAIQYSENVQLDRSAIHDMAAMYRNHRNDNVRRMAVVALESTDDSWAIDYLKRSVAYERTPKVLHTLKAVLQPEIIVGEPKPIGAR